MQKKRLKGFTLIELSVVLVIIGLIVGGILTGRDLIRSAEQRALIKQIEQYKTAVMTFKEKYESLPGDLPNATSYWPADPQCNTGNGANLSATTTCNGNGDGIIVGDTTADVAEMFMVWNHLALAKLITGYYPAVTSLNQGCCPSAIISTQGLRPLLMPAAQWSNGVPGIELYMNSQADVYNTYPGSTKGKHVFVVGIPNGSNPSNWTDDQPLYGADLAFTPNQAHAIDGKIDDGLPDSGNVLGYYNMYSSTCGNGSQNTYVKSDLLNASGSPASGCPLIFRAGF